jgi:hypothetical protein
MNIKELLIGLLIILIPLMLLLICNKSMIKDYCNYDMKCIKDEVMNKIKNLKQEKPPAEEKRSEQSHQPEIVEGFFNGLTSFFGGSGPSSASPAVSQNPMPPNLMPKQMVHKNIDESIDSLESKMNANATISKTFPPTDDDNDDDMNKSDAKNILIAGPSQQPKESEPIEQKENILKVSTPTPQPIITTSKQKDSLFDGKCQFFNNKCPDDYTQLGNFSIQGLGSNLVLNCGNITDTKPAKAIAEIKNNSIYQIHIVDEGHGYIPTKAPKVRIEGGKGHGATAESVVDDDGYLKLIKIINPGYNYVETPNIIIDPPSADSACHLCCKK